MTWHSYQYGSLCACSNNLELLSKSLISNQMCQFDQNIWPSLEGVGEENSVGRSAIANTNISVGDKECSQSIAPTKNVFQHLTCLSMTAGHVFARRLPSELQVRTTQTISDCSYYSLYIRKYFWTVVKSKKSNVSNVFFSISIQHWAHTHFHSWSSCSVTDIIVALNTIHKIPFASLVSSFEAVPLQKDRRRSLQCGQASKCLEVLLNFGPHPGLNILQHLTVSGEWISLLHFVF